MWKGVIHIKSVGMVHSGYHPLKHRPLMISVGMVHSGYHPLKHRPLRIVLGWGTKVVE